jgi:DNA repair exonuclease SbcCD ATPase subunit
MDEIILHVQEIIHNVNAIGFKISSAELNLKESNVDSITHDLFSVNDKLTKSYRSLCKYKRKEQDYIEAIRNLKKLVESQQEKLVQYRRAQKEVNTSSTQTTDCLTEYTQKIEEQNQKHANEMNEWNTKLALQRQQLETYEQNFIRQQYVIACAYQLIQTQKVSNYLPGINNFQQENDRRII